MVCPEVEQPAGLFSRLATRPVYNTRTAVLRTGVAADTFRAWERRYGLPTPARSDRNQRLFSDREIATITWLRDQTRSGVTISRGFESFKLRVADPDQNASEAKSRTQALATLCNASRPGHGAGPIVAACLEAD